jgi:hypothetical protein
MERSGKLGIRGTERFNSDAGGAEQLTHAGDIDFSVDKLADNFGQIRRPENSADDLCGDDVTSGFVVDQREDSRCVENGHSVAAASRRSASSSSTNERDFGTSLASPRNSTTASC